ncbi:C/D box methylation guide ribonucleoprotein complex aNOP56 subunit [Candidatus Bathyarchaeota archaeon]|nr:C/D box methylation guide ribonucleoprotein complex aNOP56 subunit [Candidatus Bathyarchaeota archaeon]
MKSSVIYSPLGIFAFDAENNLIEKVFFPKDPNGVADILEALGKGKRVSEIRELKKRLDDKGYDEIVSDDSMIASAFALEQGKATTDVEASISVLLRKLVEDMILEEGYFGSAKDLQGFLRDVSVAIARKAVQEESGRRDLMVIQAILTLDDLDKAFNLFANRLREWYGYHFPEMGGIVDESDQYVRLVAASNARSNLKADDLVNEGLLVDKADALVQAAQNSMGANLPVEDLNQIVEFASFLLKFYESRTTLEKYLEATLKQVAPNTLALLGPTLSARLIATAGGLGNLAKRSASTIQVLGAEKALFRALRTGSRPPKHGLIFQHKDVHQAPRWQRGKIARALAGKVAIAVRLDAYGGDYRGEQLLENYEKRLKEIRDKYAQPLPRGKRNDRSQAP